MTVWDEPLTLYVPRTDSNIIGVDPGSAIVGPPLTCGDVVDADERVTVYYESNRHNASNIVTLADKALHAGGRLRETYPTVARATVPRNLLIPVGIFDGEQITLEGPREMYRLAEWIGHGPDESELRVSSR